MRSTSRLGFVCAFALLVSPTLGYGQSLRTVPLDHWAYGIADELLLRHPDLGRGLRLAVRPWRESDFVTLAAHAREAGLTDGDSAVGFARLLFDAFPADSAPDTGPEVAIHNEVSLRYEAHQAKDDATLDPAFLRPRFGEDDRDERGRTGAPPHRAFAQHDFAVQYLDRFALGWRYAVDSYVRSDPTRFRQIGIRGGEDFGFAILDAYATVHLDHVFVTVGRNELSFGPGRGASPFLSDSIPSLDQLRIEVDTRSLRFTGLIARLSSDPQNRSLDERGETIPGSLPPESDLRDVNRLLYLHRVDWQPHVRVHLAVSEAALVTGIDRGLEFRYANLLAPFFVTQNDEDEPDGGNVNIMVEAEGAATLPHGFRGYAHAVAQEFFVDKAKREKIGNQLAWRLGGMWGDALGLPGVTAGAEYTRVDVFTYLHRGLNTNWTTYGVPLGSPLGPDADQAFGWVSWYLRPTARVTADAMVRRGGERSVETLESAVEAGNPPFPSGVVQRELRAGVEGWMLLPRWALEALVRASVWDVNDIANEDGDNRRFWQVNVGLRYRWLFRSGR